MFLIRHFKYQSVSLSLLTSSHEAEVAWLSWTLLSWLLAAHVHLCKHVGLLSWLLHTHVWLLHEVVLRCTATHVHHATHHIVVHLWLSTRLSKHIRWLSSAHHILVRPTCHIEAGHIWLETSWLPSRWILSSGTTHWVQLVTLALGALHHIIVKRWSRRLAKPTTTST